MLEQLEELDYLELEQREAGERRAWLTLRGYDLLVLAETSLASRG